MGKKRSLWKKKEESVEAPVEAPVEKKTAKDYYTQQKEKFLADERLSGMDDDRKKVALGKFFDTYGVPYVQGSGVSDKAQIDRYKQRFVDENFTKIPAASKKKGEKEVPEYQKWLDAAPSFKDFPEKGEVTPPYASVEAEESARRAIGLATGIPAIIKAPPPDSPPEATEEVAKDPHKITPQGSNKTSVQKTVLDWVELSYVEKGWPSPMNKVSQFYEGATELQRDFQTDEALGDFESSGLTEEEYNKRVEVHNQKAEQYKLDIEELADKIGIGRKENGDMFLYENEMALYKEEMLKQYRSYLNSQEEEAKDGPVKDWFQALSIGAEDVLNTGTKIMYATEGLSNQLLKLMDMKAQGYSTREDKTYWKDKAALNDEILNKHREANRRYDESITELFAAGKTGKAAMQTALSAAEALPRLSILAMGNAVGITNLTLGWMGTDKAIQQYMNTENEPNMTRFVRVLNAMGHGLSEPMFESMGTVKLLNAGRRAIKEMGEDVVRKELIKAYQPFFQRTMTIVDKGVSAMVREAGEEGATASTDDMMDIMSGVKTFEQFGETLGDEMIVGGVIGFGIGSPQMIAESGGKSKYVKNIVKTLPEEFDIESKLALASMIVKYDQLRWQMNAAPEAMKEGYKAQMAHTQDLINDMMARGEFVPTKVAPNIQKFAEKIRDGKMSELKETEVSSEIEKAGDILAKEKADKLRKGKIEEPAKEEKPAEKPAEKPKEDTERPSPELVVEESKEGKFTVKQEGDTGMTKEFESREEAEKFIDNFKMLTQGERTFEEQKKITEEKVVAGEAKKPEPVVVEKPVEKPVVKELTQEQVTHNTIVLEVRSLNQIPKTHTVKRSKKMADITRMATKLGYGLKEEKGKVIALNEKGKRIRTISLPVEYISIKEVENEEQAKFIEGFLKTKANAEGLRIKLYGEDLEKARQDVLSGRKNQNSDMLIRELQSMHDEGVIRVRHADTKIDIPIEEEQALMDEKEVDDFVKEHGTLDITNIDKALELGLIKKEDYEATKRHLEEIATSEEKLRREEEADRQEDISGKEAEVKPKLSEDMRKLAETIRKGKLDTKGTMMGTLPLFPQAVNFSIEVVATAIEGGALAIDAINTGIAKLKEQEFFKNLNEKDQKKMEEDVRAKLNELGEVEEETDAAAMSMEDENVVMDKPTSKAAPKKKVVEKPVEEGTEEEKASRKRLQDRIDARKKEINRINALKQGKARKVLDEHFVDVHEPFKKAIIKEGGEGAKKFINRMNLEAGAPARAKALIQDAQKKIFGRGFKTMSKNQVEFLSEIVDLVRTKELDDLYTKRGQKLLEHEGGITGKDAEVFLEDFHNKAPWILEEFGIKNYDPKKIMKSIDAYHQVMRDNLTKLYENGIIGENAYNNLKDEQPYYSPRRYIEHMDQIDPNGQMSGIKALQGGSVGEKVVDLNTLLSDAIARTEGLVARNIKMQAAAAYATETESAIIRKAPFSEKFKEKLKQRKEMEEQGELFEGMGEAMSYMEAEFEETPKGMVPVDYFEDGNRHRVWVDKDLYEYFDYAPADERTEMALHVMSNIAGVPILKLFATGINPEFAVKNLPIDALHAWMTDAGREYSWFMPGAMAQMSADYAVVAKDALTKTGRYRDYINEGGGMDYLATQGTEILSRYKKYTRWTSTVGQMRDGLAYIGETSEILTRLAIRERYINNRLAKAKKEGKELTKAEMKSLQEDGTAFARNYLDFSQGGKTAKLMDKFIPYFNAGVQVTRGSLRAAAKNKKLFAAKLFQITSLATTLVAWNMGAFGDDEEGEERKNAYMNDVSDQVKARNFILMTNIKYTDDANRERYRYFKIPKDALQSNLTSLAEDVYIKMFHDGAYKLLDDKAWTAMNNELRNITDITNLPPLLQASLGYEFNYDLFYKDKIWTGREQPEEDLSREFYEGVTAPRFIKFGEITKGSPVRAQYFAKQFFTEGNMYGSILGEFFDGLSKGFQGDSEQYINDAWERAKRNPPGLRRVMKSTFPKPSVEAEEAQREYNQMKTINDQRFNKLVGKKSLKDIDDKAIHDFLDETGKRDGTYEYERMVNKFEMRAKTEGVNPAIIKLKWFGPEVRALGFHKMLKDNPENSTELWKQADKAGIRSERFNNEVGRLLTMDKESEK